MVNNAMALLFGCRDAALNRDALRRLLGAFAAAHPGSLSRAATDHAVCAAVDGSAQCTSQGLVAAVVGFPRWISPRLDEIAQSQGPAQALAEAYRADRERLCGELLGSFGLAVIDAAHREIFLAVDRIGQQPLFYARTADGLVFGSRADSILLHPGIDDGIDPQGLFDYVYCHHCPSPGSIFRNLRKLEGGQHLLYRDGRISVQRYWRPAFRERPAGSVETLGEELRRSVAASVGRFAAGNRRVGAFLSGGLDSSAVAGVLAGIGETRAFSIGFPERAYDETAYARIAADRFGIRLHRRVLAPEDAVVAIPEIAAACDEPFGNSSALPTYFCARLARDEGIDLLLGGDGGDELFGGNERYARQLLFERYRAVPGPVRRAVDAVLGLPPEAAPLRKLSRYVAQAAIPLPDRLQDYNFLHRCPPAEVFTPDFLGAVDTEAPLAAMRDCYRRLPSASALNRMLYLDWKITLQDNDLVKVNRMCELAGIAVAYPMLDDALVELSCRIPSAWKVKGRRLRWFYKKAMEGFLPGEILRKPKHGFGLPFGIWMKTCAPLRELAYDSVSALRHRDFVAAGFIDRAMELHRSGHAAYYGELIWILMMLELWFQGRERKRIVGDVSFRREPAFLAPFAR
jgi:asparagine synthase (glutamine-hydrolysing)